MLVIVEILIVILEIIEKIIKNKKILEIIENLVETNKVVNYTFNEYLNSPIYTI